MDEDFVEDVVVRQWALDSAIAANKKAVGVAKVLRDARKFYGFLRPENGCVVSIKGANNVQVKTKDP